MTPLTDGGRLIDILLAIDAIETYAASEAHDDVIRDAIKYRLIVVGEASRSLSPEVRSLMPEIPWRRIRAFRNFVIHEYASVDPDTVSTIIHEHVPALRTSTTRLYADLGLELPGDVRPPP